MRGTGDNRRAARFTAALVACVYAWFGLVAACFHTHGPRAAHPAPKAGAEERRVVDVGAFAPADDNCPVCAFFGSLSSPALPGQRFAPPVVVSAPPLPTEPEAGAAQIVFLPSSPRAPPVA